MLEIDFYVAAQVESLPNTVESYMKVLSLEVEGSKRASRKSQLKEPQVLDMFLSCLSLVGVDTHDDEDEGAYDDTPAQDICEPSSLEYPPLQVAPTADRNMNCLYIVEVTSLGLGDGPKKIMLKKLAQLERALEYAKIRINEANKSNP
jgi:hypothetical protein